jgi:hypothetical protein
MAIKKFTIAFLLLFLTVLSYSQTDDADFFAEYRYFQRLSWSGDDYALRYEVMVEREEEGAYTRVNFQVTNDYSIVVSLNPGKYRYQVIPYNYFDAPAAGTGWIDFEVHPALRPETEEYVQIFDYPSTAELLQLDIYGKNISADAKLTLSGADGAVFYPDETNIAEDGSKVTITFYNAYLIDKDFSIQITNPGGLETNMEVNLLIPPLPVPHPSIFGPPEIYMSFSMMPMFSLYGNTNWLSVQDIAMPGVAFRIAGVVKRIDALFGIGLETAVSWNEFDKANSFLLDFNLLALVFNQNNNMDFKIRLGMGYNALFGPEKDYYSNWKLVHINMGFHYIVLLFRNFYLEMGVDCMFWAGATSSGAIRPMAGLGLRFP